MADPAFRVDLRQLKAGLEDNKKAVLDAVKAARREGTTRLAGIIAAEAPVDTGALKSTIKGLTASAKIGSKASPYTWPAYWGSSQVQDAGYPTKGGPEKVKGPRGFVFAGFRPEVQQEIADLISDHLSKAVGRLNA